MFDISRAGSNTTIDSKFSESEKNCRETKRPRIEPEHRYEEICKFRWVFPIGRLVTREATNVDHEKQSCHTLDINLMSKRFIVRQGASTESFRGLERKLTFSYLAAR